MFKMLHKVLLPFVSACLVFTEASVHAGSYRGFVDIWLKSVDDELFSLNRRSADLVWNMAVAPNDTLFEKAIELTKYKNQWKNSVCKFNANGYTLSEQQKRKIYLLCRGAKYSTRQAKALTNTLDELSDAYISSEVCVPNDFWLAKLFPTTDSGEICLKGEPDLEKAMTLQNLTSEQLQWIWTSWHDTAGKRVKEFYPKLIAISNSAAKSSGYADNGEVWREELEIPNLEHFVKLLYKDIHPLYVKLHAVIREKLVRKYGRHIVNPSGPIPAHLLGSMWAQDWSSLLHLLVPAADMVDLNENIARKNWTARKMTVLAEDMYVSMNLPKMTRKFWAKSKFRKDNDTKMCHGSAANMFKKNDYRMLVCAESNMQDFYVIHHEMGHVEYYMAYSKQPVLFQDGANSAFQESIGDTVMIGVMAPQHLYRLGLLNEKQLTSPSLDIVLLLLQALTKIPQIPYALIIDLYRWDIFKEKINPLNYNAEFWKMNERLRGIAPPTQRGEEYFDAGAKFHIADNTPYIRYFLGAILQMEMFKSMCEITVFGKTSTTEEQLVIPFPLHKCDIYGSKKAGKQLRLMMEKGASEHWMRALKLLTGKDEITVKPLLEFYKPLGDWLDEYITTNAVPVGW